MAGRGMLEMLKDPYHYHCTQCDSKYTRRHGLTRHIASAHAAILQKVCECAKRFKSNAAYINHRKESCDARLHDYLCYRCGREFDTETGLKIHRNSHRGGGTVDWQRKQIKKQTMQAMSMVPPKVKVVKTVEAVEPVPEVKTVEPTWKTQLSPADPSPPASFMFDVASTEMPSDEVIKLVDSWII